MEIIKEKTFTYVSENAGNPQMIFTFSSCIFKKVSGTQIKLQYVIFSGLLKKILQMRILLWSQCFCSPPSNYNLNTLDSHVRVWGDESIQGMIKPGGQTLVNKVSVLLENSFCLLSTTRRWKTQMADPQEYPNHLNLALHITAFPKRKKDTFQLLLKYPVCSNSL